MDLGLNLHLEVLPLLLNEEVSYPAASYTVRGIYHLVQGPRSMKSSLRDHIEIQQLKEKKVEMKRITPFSLLASR